MERPQDSKRPKFWERVSEGETPITPKAVFDLEVGKYTTTSVTLRISTVSPVRVGATGTKYFRFSGIDVSGTIDVVCFGDQALAVAQIVVMNKVIMFSKMSIVFSGFSGNKEMHLSKDTVCIEVPDTGNTPEPHWSFVDISDLDPANSEADILGVVVGISDLIVGSKDGRGWQRRDITLIDRGSVEIVVAFWGQDAENVKIQLYSTLAFLNVHVGAHNGVVNASVRLSSTIWLDPELNVAQDLKQWFQAEAKGSGLNLQ